MTRSLPQYRVDLAGFAGALRQYLGLSQRKVASLFHLSHSTIARYEGEGIDPPVGYLACMGRLVLEKQQRTTTQSAEAVQSQLLQEINKALAHNYPDEPSLHSWAELDQVATEYLAERQATTQTTNQEPDPLETQPLPSLLDLAVTPAEPPPSPHFYIERKTLQEKLLEKIKTERVQALVIWGQGGSGKSTLAVWLARTLAADFPDGQIWIELPSDLPSTDTIREAQTQMARRFGVRLNSTSLAERAGQLRTLFQDKQCLLILDDVWHTSDLKYVQVLNQKSCLLLTTRYRKVADVLEMPYLEIGGMTTDEGAALLGKWTDASSLQADELINRLGGLPLALKLSGIQLREGDTPTQLLTYFQSQPVDLNRLALDTPQASLESLSLCFDRSFQHLTTQQQSNFARLGCFAGRFDVAACVTIWGLAPSETKLYLKRLDNLALVERTTKLYHLHPLIRDYASQKLTTTSQASDLTYRRHAAYYIRHYLYHPQVLDDVIAEPPRLDETWNDVVAGVKWASQSKPQLATIAALLAHSERAALLEAVGPSLIDTIEKYLPTINLKIEQATLHELLGDLYILSDNIHQATTYFDQAALLWQSNEHELSSIRARLRLTGLYLIRQNMEAAVEMLRQAQSELSEILPISEVDLEAARWVFYWFDLIYTICVKGGNFAQLKKCAAELVDLAQKTKQPLLEARSWHIYQLLYTSPEMTRSEADRQQGRNYAAKAAWLWWRHGDQDKALVEIMWTQERTKKHRSRRMAVHFAHRLSRATPQFSQEQIQLLKISNERVRRWLTMSEEERVAWLIKILPPPGDNDWSALADILSIGTMGEQTRRLAEGLPYPGKHLISEPLWKILTGQRPMPLFGPAAVNLINRYVAILEDEFK